jgi:hypothetical protein
MPSSNACPPTSLPFVRRKIKSPFISLMYLPRFIMPHCFQIESIGLEGLKIL